MSQKTIWNYLRGIGMTETGAAGMMGNLAWESGLRSDNLEDYYEGRLGMNDSQYITAVDNGTYQNFEGDACGFGLAQWTYHKRKKELLSFAKMRGVSIADESMQLDFLHSELRTDFRDLFAYLKQADDLFEATDKVCRQFENPAIKNTDARYQIALRILSECTAEQPKAAYTVEAANMPILRRGAKGLAVGMVQFALARKGYNIGKFGENKDGLDCDFGETMEKALILFKADNGLGIDPVVDGRTWEALYE